MTIKSQKEFINIHHDANCKSITEQSDTFAQLDQKPEKFALNDSKAREVFVKEEYEFLCASGTPRHPDRPRQSSMAEGSPEQEDDVGIAEGDPN